ncbi:MAG TPA: transcription termination factor NusA, partial [Limnochordales bacterium]
MNLELLGALNELEKERGISREVLIKAIEDAIQSALRRSAQPTQNLRVDFDERSGRVRVFARKAVVRQVVDPANEISLEEAQRLNPRFEVDDVVEVELTLPELGRIAAQTAKQVVVQRIREAERNRVYEEFHSREGDILTGVIRRIEHRHVYVDLGRAEGVLPPSEQVPTERYAPGVRMKFYVAEVRRTTKGPQVVLSRTHPGLLKRLLELEVPEVHDGVVEIKACAREPGHRSKVAVWSTDRNVDPVGACVGPRAARVQQVSKELRQEKVDVVAWDPDPETFVANALSPARPLKVYLDPEERTARVIVSEKDLSKAIGAEGQNARLAAKLTGWRIDIKGDSQWAEVEREFQEKRARLSAQAQAAQAPAASAATQEPAPAPAAAAARAAPAGAVGAPEQPVAAPAAEDHEAPEVPAAAEQEPQAVSAGAWQGEEEPEVAAPAGAPDEEEEEQRLRVKGGGKVRRLKGFRRLERRHLEEELEDAEALPTLFDEAGEPEPAGPAPGPAAPAAGATAGLSVRLLDLLKAEEMVRRVHKPAEGRQHQVQPKPAAPAAAASAAAPANAAAGGAGTAADRGADAAGGRPATAPAPASSGRPATPVPAAPPGAGAAGDGTDARRPAPAPAPPGASGKGQPPAAAPPSRDKAQAGTKAAAEPAERDKESKEKKKGKVLKSLAELSLEDFG